MKFRFTLAMAACMALLLECPARASGTGEAALWISAWAAPQSDAFLSVSLNNETLRQVITAHREGHTIRVRLSNLHGKAPVPLAKAYIGLSAGDADVMPGSSRALRFRGLTGLILQPGERVWSDPIELDVKPMQRMTLSLYAPGRVTSLSRHYGADEYMWKATGNQAASEEAGRFSRIDNPLLRSWALVDGVEVQGKQAGGVLVAFGDSITDGYVPDPKVPLAVGTALNGRDERYPDFLSRRLIAAGKSISVVNAGIGANRLLSGPVYPLAGDQGSKRLQRDVLDVSGVTDALVLIGINDLGAEVLPRSDTLIAGLKETALRLKQAGVRALFGTLLPARHAFYGLANGRASVERARQEVNQWIRTSPDLDAVIDFDACLRDPIDPSKLRADYDSGDHLHPNAKGYEAMGACVDLALF